MGQRSSSHVHVVSISDQGHAGIVQLVTIPVWGLLLGKLRDFEQLLHLPPLEHEAGLLMEAIAPKKL